MIVKLKVTNAYYFSKAMVFGREIVQELEQQLRIQGYTESRAAVRLKDWPALRFWTKQGYNTVTKISGDREFAPQHYAVIELRKTLKLHKRGMKMKQKPTTGQIVRIVSEAKAQEVFGLTMQARKVGRTECQLLCPCKYVQNDYEDRGKTLFDRTTGLMWQQSGSDAYMNYTEAQQYIENLNREQFAGYADWRMPSIPELMSLLEPAPNDAQLFINPIFDATQHSCWSADRLPEGDVPPAAWYVLFSSGSVSWIELPYFYYVRAVRSSQ